MESASLKIDLESSPMNRAHIKLTATLLLTLLVLAVAGVSIERKVRSFQPLGFQAERAGGGMRVTGVTDAGTGLRPGDQILLVASGAVPPAPELAKRLRETPRTEMVVLRDGALDQFEYRRPDVDFDFPYLILALCGIAYLLIGVYTLLRLRGSQGFLFCLWCLTSAALYLLTPVPPADSLYRAVYLLDELARVLLPALTLHLFLVFPVPLRSGSWARRALPFLYLPAAALLTLQVGSLRGWFGDPTAAGLVLLDRLETAHMVVLSLAGIGVLVYRLMRGRDWEQHRQVQWMAVGLAAGYVPFLALYAVPFALGLRWPELVTSAAVVPLLLVPLTFAYAILRYKLWDIEIIVRDTVASALTLLIGLIGFSLMNQALNRGIPREMEVAHNFLAFASGLGIAALLVPTRRTLASALERLHYRDRFGRRRALSDFGRELLLERDLGRLCAALLEQIETGVELETANLYLAAPGGLLFAVRPEPGLPPQIPCSSLGDELWDGGFLRLSGLGLPTEPPSPVQKIFAAGYRYAFPLTVRDRAVGIIVVGFKQDHAPLSSEDILLIRHLLNQAALAIENAQLLAQLHQQLEEVQRLQHYSEGIFESSPAGIAVLDADRRLVSANAAFVSLSGRERRDLLGRDLDDVLPLPALPALGAAPIQAEMRDGLGKERFLELSLAPHEGGLSGLGGGLVVLVVHDITERVAMENALRDKERLAALGMLAAGVAHEVNTPITGISSYAQILLSETAEDDPRYDLLKKVERQTFRAARIVNNLLELSRDRKNEKRAVALAPLLRETLDLLADRRRRVEVDFSLPQGAVTVMGCDGELQQVFTNLFVNAFDALDGAETGPDGRAGHLTVEMEEDDRKVRVRVRDNGPGIPADKLETIFQPFYSTKLNRGGTGLGLAISREIVRRHGGDLQVVSRPGEGACFTVELPRDPAGTAGSAVAEATA
jgi:two-component system NtrC family sensor kinase